jgi:hypothetical protein
MKKEKNTNKLEERLLGGFDYESELKKQIDREIEDARKMREKQNSKDYYFVETDISKLSKEEKFDRHTVYKVFNRKEKTETFVNGEQAQNLIKYTDTYVVMFDHRIVENI